MPKRKKLPPLPDYIGIGENSEKLLVQKSNPLLTLSETDITLSELKILDAYLSRINSHDPDKRLVRFEKGELEKLLGNTWMHKDDLEKRLRNLFQVVEIADERYPKQINLISLFEKASCTQDEDGLWQVDLMCTPSAMEYIFNVENLGYLKYRLKSVVNLTSRYSYVLYLFLESNCCRKNIEFALDDLKTILNCNAVRYDEFKFFNAEILKKCQKEINEKTDISYTYTTIKKGRKVVAISFEVERKLKTEVSIEPIKQELHEIEPPKNKKKPSKPQEDQAELDKDKAMENILRILLSKKMHGASKEEADLQFDAMKAMAQLRVKDQTKVLIYLAKMVENYIYTSPEDNSDGFNADEYEMFLNNF